MTYGITAGVVNTSGFNAGGINIFLVKGIVQQEFTTVENSISQKVFLSHWTVDIVFLNVKGTCSLYDKNWFLRLKQNYVAHSVP
jgi:hypothetical protein